MTKVNRIYPNPFIDEQNKNFTVISEILDPAKVFEGYWGGNFISPISPAQSMLEVSKHFGYNATELFRFEFSINRSDLDYAFDAYAFTNSICKFFSDHQSVYAVHYDSDKFYCHILVSTVNFKDGQLLQMDNETIQSFYQHIFFHLAEHCLGTLQGSVV